MPKKLLKKLATQKAKLIEETRNLNEGIGYKALIMVMDAHVHNLIQPGSYSNRLNELLNANGLEEINIPTPQTLENY